MKCGQKGQRASLKEKPVILKFLYTEEAQKTRRATWRFLPTSPIFLLKYGVTQPADSGTVNPGTPGETGKPDAPKTGDTGNIIVWVLAASFTVAMIPVTVTLKRKSR